MRHGLILRALFVLSMLPPLTANAQPQDGSVPRLVTITGVYRPADGTPTASIETVTLSIYADEQGGAPLFQETQQVTLDDRGRYSVVLGAAHADGIPSATFATGQWLGTVFERPGEVEGARVRLTSVPYAMRAAEADTLGGHPASDYVLTASASGGNKTASTSSHTDVAGAAGTVNFLSKYVDGVNLGDSAVYESGGQVGLGTTVPFDVFHVRYTNTGGNLTGFAVQNMGNTPTSYSGMLFYDQNNQLGQFQGFNNVTHEYRINNIARNGASQFDGSINFMVGSVSKFFVGANGGIGIGTTSVAPGLEVSNSLTGALTGAIGVSTFGNSPFGGTIIARKARGTQAAPAAVQNNDQIALFVGVGQASATNSGAFGNGMEIKAAENFTPATQGTSMNFYTTARGTNTPTARVTITHDGNVGIGTMNPGNSLEVAKDDDANVVLTSAANGVPGIFFQKARGTLATPSAVQNGDVLGVVGGNGYGATTFGDVNAAIGMIATENWTDTAHGTGMGFLTTPVGSVTMGINLAILPDGKIGMGTPVVNGFPTATDRLQVFGDIRVGTTGTNGCLKDFSGGVLAGTCSSDRRFKKDIMPFGSVLNQLTALQPVHYFWRTAEFPDHHFGNDRADGLIAQDVEQVLPELVATDSDGYKAINYSKLPLLTIQAVKELKEENDALKERVATLERLVTDLLAAARR